MCGFGYDRMGDFMTNVVGVRFRDVGKIYYFDPVNIELKVRDMVVVETSRGVECGSVILANREVSDSDIVKPLKKVMRKATAEDIIQIESNRSKEAEAYKLCKEKIIEHGLDMKLIAAEYTFDGTKVLFYFTADGRIDFRDLVIPITKGYDISNAAVEIENIGSASSEYIDLYIRRKYNEFVQVEEPYLFSDEDLGKISLSGENITIKEEGVYKFLLSISGLEDVSLYNDNFNAVVTLYINGNRESYYRGDEESYTALLSLHEGDVVSFLLEVSAIPAESPYDEISFIDEEEFIEIIKANRLSVFSNISLEITKQTGGIFLDYSKLLPGLTQKDFVKEVMQRFGLLMRPHKFNKQHYEFIEIEKLLNDRENAEDWSSKFVSHSEQYTIGGYGRKNMFQYTYPDELNDKNFASGVLSVANEAVDKERRVVKSVFTAIKPKMNFDEIALYSVPLWEVDGDNLKTREAKPYLFSIKRHDTTVRIKQSGVTNDTEITDEIPFLDFTPCYYQNYINTYYKALGYLLEKGKKITAEMRLNAVDIYNLDFFRLKYIEQLGGYFYLNKVSGFKGKETVIVELIETGNKVIE